MCCMKLHLFRCIYEYFVAECSILLKCFLSQVIAIVSHEGVAVELV